MDKVIEKLREFKTSQEAEGEAIIDISYYGKLNLSKNDADMSNERKEDLYLVKKEVNGKTELEFRTEKGKIATIGEEGAIQITPEYKELINEKEFLLQLKTIIPLSLEKLEEIEKNKSKTVGAGPVSAQEKKEDTPNERKKYIENPKDSKINPNKKITETKNFYDLVPEAKTKGIVDVRVRRLDNSKFEIIGIDTDGYEVPLESLASTEGTNPSKDIVEISKGIAKKDQVMTMLKIKNGQNEGKQNEGFTIDIGDYGIPEVQYYRRSPELNEYTSIQVNLENTNQKRTQKEEREYIEKKRNTTVNDNIQKAEDRIEFNEQEETPLENIDDDPYNNIVDPSEIQIRKAAKRCKVSVEEFKNELETAEGNTLEEKIDSAEEAINEQYRGKTGKRV